MQERWAVMSGEGAWARDASGKVLTYLSVAEADALRDALNEGDDGGSWTTEPFTVEDALEEMTRSPFAAEGGL